MESGSGFVLDGEPAECVSQCCVSRILTAVEVDVVAAKEVTDNGCVHRLSDVVHGTLRSEAKPVVPGTNLDAADAGLRVGNRSPALSYEAG